jgi:hypothetical protein
MLCNSKYTINFVSFQFGQIIGFTLSCVQVWQNLLVYVPCSYSTIILLPGEEKQGRLRIRAVTMMSGFLQKKKWWAAPEAWQDHDAKCRSNGGWRAGPAFLDGQGQPNEMLLSGYYLSIGRTNSDHYGRRCHHNVETNSRESQIWRCESVHE